METQPMTPNEAQLFGEITAMNSAIEWIFTQFLAALEKTPDEIHELANDHLAHIEKPFRNDPHPGEDLFLVQQVAINRIETLWKLVEARLEARG
jgi:hypothetical protein